MCNFYHIRYFKNLIKTQKIIRLELRELINLDKEIKEILEKVDLKLIYILQENRALETQIERLIDYRQLILDTRHNINIDISQIRWRLKTLKNMLDWIPLG